MEIKIMMVRGIVYGLIAAFVSLAWGPFASAASFDCTKSDTRTERLICSTPDLSVRDEILARVFKASLAHDPSGTVRREQRKWLTDQQQPCANVECLREAYDDRFSTLSLGSNNDVVQRYTRTDRNGELDLVTAGEWLYFTVNAVWQGDEPGDVNTGEATGLVRLANGRGRYDLGDGCVLSVAHASNDAWRVSEQGCETEWGLNVTLAGLYARAPGDKR